MVSTKLYDGGESRKYTAFLSAQIRDCNYIGARRTAENLRDCLLRYFETRGVNCDNIFNLFNEFDFLLKVCSSGRIKQRLCYDFFQKISNINQLSVSDPVERFQQIYEDLRFAYLNLINRESFETILDCFDEMRALKSGFAKIGGPTYTYYTLVLRDTGKCESILLDLSVTGKLGDKKVVVDTFKDLFANCQRVIAPPVIIRLTPVELSQQIKAGLSLEELSEATGHREEELQAMLTQIEQGGDEE